MNVIICLLIFLDFIGRFYGPIQADDKKIHISIVGCLRNERNSKRKRTESSDLYHGDETRDENMNNTCQSVNDDDCMTNS